MTSVSSAEYEEILDLQTPIPPAPTRWKKIKTVLNIEEYWTLYVGMFWFCCVLGTSFWGAKTSRFYLWGNEANKISDTLSPGNVSGITLIVLFLIFTLTVVHWALDKPNCVLQYAALLSCVVISKFIASNVALHDIGMGDAIWCLVLGFLIRNVLRQGDKFKHVLGLEFFIKVSIVLLATDFNYILAIGWRGILLAWVETAALIALLYLAGRYVLKMYEQTALIVSCGVSICGSSAAMTITDVIKADRTIAESLIAVMSILTIPLIPTMHLMSNQGVSDNVIGAWIGGSVDSTGAVIASASLGGDEVLATAVVIKMLQNILIGPTALIITAAWYRTFKPAVLWDRFPKFVLGYLAVAVVTTFVPVRDKLTDNSFVLSEWFSAVSFVLIGMDIDVVKFFGKFETRIFILYVVGQIIDLASTFGVAFLLFRNVNADATPVANT